MAGRIQAKREVGGTFARNRPVLPEFGIQAEARMHRAGGRAHPAVFEGNAHPLA
jgi:hypothetical protein